jgi:hypothetical protein
MVQIIDVDVELEPPLGSHLHALVAQLPNHLRPSEYGYAALVDPEHHWRTVRSVLELVAHGDGSLQRLHFLLLPETSVPFVHFDDALALIDQSFRPNTVTVFGVEQVRLRTYRQLLERFSDDGGQALELVEHDLEAGDSPERPVNWCCIAVKDARGRLRVFLEAKSHPYRGEEFLDHSHDLYRGRHFYMLHGRPACFNFMVLICLDYLFRDLYASNIRQIIDHANQLYFGTRQSLDALMVLQCEPTPEHRAYFEVLSGFYGEYLEDTPGVRDTVTLFCNSSEESTLEGYTGGGSFGGSSVVLSSRHKMPRVSLPELATDDFGGAPIGRLRFGGATRLYYVHVQLHHELDPRSSRLPVKVHAIMRRGLDGRWTRVTGDEMVEGLDG